MELIGQEIHLSDHEQRNAGMLSNVVPLYAARVVAERLLQSTQIDIAHQDQTNALLGYTLEDGKSMAIALPAWRKQAVAQGLLDIADLELGMEE